MNNTLKSVVLASVGVALALQNASAGNTYNDGDLLLSFRETGSPDLIFDIGQASLYINAAGPINLTSEGYNSTFLTTVYGASLAGVKWSVAGFTASDHTTWATDVRLTPGNNPATPFTSTISASLQQSDTQISTYGNQFRNGAGATFLSAFATEAPTGNAGSYTSIQGSPNNGNLKKTFQADIENSIQASGNSQSDLYTLIPGATPGSPGYFSIDPSGSVTFNPVPEPSTYCLLPLGGVLLFAFRRHSARSHFVPQTVAARR
jgi:hypothetical protein